MGPKATQQWKIKTLDPARTEWEFSTGSPELTVYLAPSGPGEVTDDDDLKVLPNQYVWSVQPLDPALRFDLSAKMILGHH